MTLGLWGILIRAVASLKICTSMCYFCRKYMLEPKKKSTEELRVITLKNDAKFKEELTCAMKNDMRNWANFDPTLESLKIYALIGSFSPKYTMFELKNYRGVKHHYTEDRCKL